MSECYWCGARPAPHNGYGGTVCATCRDDQAHFIDDLISDPTASLSGETQQEEKR